VQRQQDACVLIQESKAAHKEELDQVQQEKGVHKEELIKVQQDLALAATTVLDLQNRLEAATRTPEAVSEAVSEATERQLMQKLIDIQQNLTNVGRSCEDIKAVVCPETSVHHALAPASTLSKSERLDNLKQTAMNVEAVKPHDAENALQESATGVGQVTRDTDCPAVSSGDVMINQTPYDDYPVADMNLNSVVGSAFDAHSDAKADETRHLEDRAETSQTQKAPHVQVALEHATDAELLLSAERRTETSASTTRLQRQSRCAPFPYNKFKQEDCDWTSHDCKQVKKMLGIKRGKKEPWLPDSCVVVNLLKDIHCNKKCPQNWNILLPSIDSPVFWVSNGKAFNKKATGIMMYQLIGQLALHLGSLQDKLQEGMATDVMGDIEGYTDYYRLLEDIGNAESSEGYESEFNTLSMHIKDIQYKHFQFIEGHKLIEGH